MLTMAAQLREVHDQQQEKKAAAGTSRLTGARQHLEATLTKNGYQIDPAEDQLIKHAAAQASADPVLAQAALSLQIGALGAAK